MIAIITYILQVCAWFLPLYWLYLFVFKNYTFHNWNRWYLLLMSIASFTFPFVHIKIVENKTIFTTLQNNEHLSTQFIEKENNSINDIISNTVQQTNTWHWLDIVAAIYLIGVCITGAKFLYGLFNIKRLIEKAKHSWRTNIAMIFTTDAVPHSSFFSYIFINKKTKSTADLDKIIYHEMQHQEKLHSVDVLWCELLKVLLWFNPAVYWYKKSLQEIHEFEVDAEMTKLYNKESYAQLLVRVASQNLNKLINTFSSKPLKTRIMMLFNKKTYPAKKLAFLLVLPVIAVLLMAYGNVKHKTITTIRTVEKPLTLIIDAGHGGTDKGATNGTENESDLTLQYATELAAAAKEAGYAVVLTRAKDTAVSLKDRVKIKDATSAAAFISIHFNNATDATKNGIEAFVKNTTEGNEASEKLADKILLGTKELNGISTNYNLQKRKVGIFVLATGITPSVLLELGYLSNTNDVKYITNAANRQHIIDKIILGINNYFDNK